MADDKLFGGKLPTVIVKGGTSTGRYDRELAKSAANAEARRAEEDRRHAAARVGAQQTNDGFQFARQGSARFVNDRSPRLVLRYLNQDGTVRQDCKSEITFIDHPTDPTALDMVFALVCPRCLSRGVPQGEAQMLVRQSHRKFWIDERHKGVQRVLWPWGPEDVLICGTVTVQDTVRCSNYNCDYAIRIENSDVREV